MCGNPSLRILFAAGAVLLLLAVPSPAQEKKPPQPAEDADLPFYERSPYDEIHLKSGEVVKVQPLVFEGGKPPEQPAVTARLKCRLLAEPDEEYTILWRHIEKVKQFKRLILDEAEKLVAAGKFSQAFFFYRHLRRRFQGKLDGLDESTAGYFMAEAQDLYRQRDYALALARLNESYDVFPKLAGLGDGMAATVGKLMEGYVAKEKFEPARALLAALKAKFANHAAVGLWEKRFGEEAQKLLDAAKKDHDAGRLHEARELALRSVRIWPLDDARKLLVEAQKKSPRIVVGVTLPASRFDPERFDDWASRRAGRLIHRTLLEFTGHGPQGGVYRCPFGEAPKRRKLGQQLVLELRPGLRWSDSKARLGGADVLRHLLAMSDSRDRRNFRPDWAAFFSTASVRGLYEVQIDFRRTHVHPEAFLQTVVVPWHARGHKQPPTTGPYHLHAASEGETRFRANPGYFAAGPDQPEEIIERYFADGRSAAAALRAGEIAVLDRVNPWEIERLQAIERLAVEPYAVPTVHCLLPQGEHPLLARRVFRRALISGIHRQGILDELLKGSQLPGNMVVSGPFPAGLRRNDPIAYAYNYEVQPRPYRPGLAITLVKAAVEQEAVARKKREQPPLADLSLVLAHPPHDVARVACRAIRDQLVKVGVTIKLREIPPGSSTVACDLRYAELALWEPVIDARRLFGPSGLVGRYSSPFMRLALRQLESADEWRRARDKLLEIHRLAHEDGSVIPLWQLTDHMAYHRALQGVGERPVSLYHNVEQWKSPPAILPDTIEPTGDKTAKGR